MTYPLKPERDTLLTVQSGAPACCVGVESFERCRIELLQETRITRHAAQNQPLSKHRLCLPRLPTSFVFTYRLDPPPQKACHPPQLMLLRERRSVETTAQTTICHFLFAQTSRKHVFLNSRQSGREERNIIINKRD